jgi:hypothetical protein
LAKKKVKQTTMRSFPAERGDSNDPVISPKGGGSGVDGAVDQKEAAFGKTFKSPRK